MYFSDGHYGISMDELKKCRADKVVDLDLLQKRA